VSTTAGAAAGPLRVAHVSGERGFSGGEVQVFLLMEGLRARGHEGLLVCPPGSRSERAARERGFEVACVSMPNDLALPAAWRIAGVLRRRRPSIVHCHTGRANWLGGLAARWAGIPAVTTRRMDRRVARGWRTRWLYERLLRRAVAISPAVARRLQRAGVPPSRVRVIWSAVDPAALAPSAPRDRLRRGWGVGPETTLVLVAANLVRRKGVDVLLRALAAPELPAEARLWVAGDGPERAALEAMATSLGVADRVRFLGRRDDVPDLLEACDVFALPSRREGLGVAALEAMARARPVVASRVGGLAETVVAGETGLLVPPDDPPALAGALARLVVDPPLRRRLGEAGPQRVAQGFLAEQMVSAYESLYREVVAEAAR